MVSGGTIASLNLTNLNVTGIQGSGSPRDIGGLVGTAVNATIFGVNVSGNVSALGSTASSYVGGLVGNATGTSIVRSSSTVNVTGGAATVGTGSYTGGLVGILTGSSVVQSTSSGSVAGGGQTNSTPSSENGNVSALASTGGLIGYAAGSTITGSSTSAAVTGGRAVSTSSTGPSVAFSVTGGLVGQSAGTTISRSSATGAVTSGSTNAASNSGNVSSVIVTGGLVGETIVGATIGSGTITQSSATGSVRTTSTFNPAATVNGTTGTREITILSGGLIGSNSASLSQVFATGNVSGGNAGGLVGLNNGTIDQAYATGSVAGGFLNTGSGSISLQLGSGGLVAVNGLAGSITRSYALGSVVGGSVTATTTNAAVSTGGLVGINTGVIQQAYAQGSVRGGSATAGTFAATSETGGLIGRNGGVVSQAYATGAVTSGTTTGGSTSSASFVGGLVGRNALTPPSGTGFVPTVVASFWDTTTTGQAAAAGGFPVGRIEATGLTTAEFQNPATFVPRAIEQGWNFQSTWAPPSAGFYPELYAVSRVIAVTANPAERPFGQANPTLTGTVSGGPGVNAFDTASVQPSAASLLTTTATETSPAGTYDITPVSQFVSVGGVTYRVTGTPSTLTVAAAQQPTQNNAERASDIADARVTPNVTTILPNFSTAALSLGDAVDLSGGGGPTIGVAQGDGGGQTRTSARTPWRRSSGPRPALKRRSPPVIREATRHHGAAPRVTATPSTASPTRWTCRCSSCRPPSAACRR